jgi:hypothetical protein
VTGAKVIGVDVLSSDADCTGDFVAIANVVLSATVGLADVGDFDVGVVSVGAVVGPLELGELVTGERGVVGGLLGEAVTGE